MNRFKKIAEFGKELMHTEIHNTLDLITKAAKHLVHPDRCSLFILDNKNMIPWTKLSDRVGRIVIALDAEIAGDSYKCMRRIYAR